MAYKILLTKKVERQLRRLSSSDAKQIIRFLQKFDFPFEKNLDIKKLLNSPDFFRIRFGKIRIIFEIDHRKKEIWIRRVAYRGRVYQI